MGIQLRHIEKIYDQPQVTLSGRFLKYIDIPSHAHTFTELMLITQGNCILKAGKSLLEGHPGDLFVIPPKLSHVQFVNELVGSSFIGFDYEAEDFDLSFRVISLKNEIYITRWIDNIVDLNTIIYDNKQYSEEVSCILKAILSRLNRFERHQYCIRYYEENWENSKIM